MVERVEIAHVGGDRFRVSVTLRHADEGWEHYADRWIVTDGSGAVLGKRVLLHPHVAEQPFTRSATVVTPDGVSRIRIVARDSRHGDSAPSAPFAVPGR